MVSLAESDIKGLKEKIAINSEEYSIYNISSLFYWVVMIHPGNVTQFTEHHT